MARPFDADDPAFLAAGRHAGPDRRAADPGRPAGPGVAAGAWSAASSTASPRPSPRAVEDASRLSGRTVDVIHLVGGGSRNALLCQLTADACGRPVVAGPVEATAIGNLLVQARAHGFIEGDLESLRALVRATSDLRRYEPRRSRRAADAAGHRGYCRRGHPMTRRRLPRPSELRPYLRTGPIHLSPVERRLASAATIWDLRTVARRHVPRAVFDYTDGAAETETSLRRSREAYARIEFVPSVLRDVSSVDLSTTILGRPSAMPLVFAPTGFTRLMHQEGEPAVTRVAGRLGIPYALSTLGTTSPEAVALAVARHGPLVPALPVERPRRRARPGPTRPGRRVLGAGPDRRHAGRRRPAAGRPQRLHDPADAVAPDRSSTWGCIPAGGSTS